MLYRSRLLLQTRRSTLRISHGFQQWQHSPRRALATNGPDQTGQDSYGLITTTSPHTTSIEHLLDELKNADRFSQSQDGAGRSSLLALFLTPAYAQHALDTELPLKVFEGLKGSRRHDKELRAVTAVVDRLPAADQNDSAPSKGVDGLAYTFINSLDPPQEELLGNRTLQDLSSASSKQLSQPRPGVLSFRIDAVGRQARHVDIQLPLAQTVFSTGRTSTMVGTTYRPDTGKNTLTVTEPLVALDSQHLPTIYSLPDHVMKTSVPLIPLTLTRRVDRCMGNIVRTLSSQPTRFGKKSKPETESLSSKSQPASSELEKVIKDFFSRHNLDPRPVQVWALIIPGTISPERMTNTLYASLRDILRSKSEDMEKPIDPDRMQRGLSRLVRNMGSRLCRVLSGGGGWGKKAGLLSLDPDVDYSSSESSAFSQDPGLHFVESMAELEQEKKSALGEIVKEGDNIVFLLGPPAFAAGEDASERKKYFDLLPTVDLAPPPAASSRSLLFGCLPSSVDDLVVVEEDESLEQQAPSAVQHLKNAFGVLSEGGMALTSTPAKPDGFTAQTQTKLDVPYSRLVIQEDDDSILMTSESGDTLFKDPGSNDQAKEGR